MLEFIKKYWKYILIFVFVSIMLLSNYIYISKLQRINKKAQIELIDIKAENAEKIELEKQKLFNDTIQKIDSVIVEKEKQIDEIRENIKSPNVDFANDSIRKYINSEYNKRFHKNRE